MQFNLVNDQEQVAQFVRRGIVWRGVSVCCGGCLKRSVGLWGRAQGVFGQF